MQSQDWSLWNSSMSSRGPQLKNAPYSEVHSQTPRTALFPLIQCVVITVDAIRSQTWVSRVLLPIVARKPYWPSAMQCIVYMKADYIIVGILYYKSRYRLCFNSACYKSLIFFFFQRPLSRFCFRRTDELSCTLSTPVSRAKDSNTCAADNITFRRSSAGAWFACCCKTWSKKCA